MTVFDVTLRIPAVEIVHKSISINVGETWINEQGCTMVILGVGNTQIWCEWQNGYVGHWEVQKFIEAGYKLKQ